MKSGAIFILLLILIISQIQLSTSAGCGNGDGICPGGCNANNDNDCSPVCGNNAVEPGETCDNGSNNGQPNYCNSQCSGVTTPVCGNNVAESGESCDEGQLNGQLNHCNSQCSGIYTICGNGAIETSEQCDDANTANADGCSSTCQIEQGYSCSGTPSFCTLKCGNGLPNQGEQCDDGNRQNGDGCSSTCQIESSSQTEDQQDGSEGFPFLPNQPNQQPNNQQNGDQNNQQQTITPQTTPDESIDADSDGIQNENDNCPDVANSQQIDSNNNNIGDVCDETIAGEYVINPDLTQANNFDEPPKPTVFVVEGENGFFDVGEFAKIAVGQNDIIKFKTEKREEISIQIKTISKNSVTITVLPLNEEETLILEEIKPFDIGDQVLIVRLDQIGKEKLGFFTITLTDKDLPTELSPDIESLMGENPRKAKVSIEKEKNTIFILSLIAAVLILITIVYFYKKIKTERELKENATIIRNLS